MRVLINNIMQVERAKYLQAGEYKQSEDRKGYANGYKPITSLVPHRDSNITSPYLPQTPLNIQRPRRDSNPEPPDSKFERMFYNAYIWWLIVQIAHIWREHLYKESSYFMDSRSSAPDFSCGKAARDSRFVKVYSKMSGTV